MDEFIAFLFIALIISSIVWRIYNSCSHSKYSSDMILKEDATIIDIKSENIGGRKVTNCMMRTTVTFSDGFQFLSPKASVTLAGFNRYRVSTGGQISDKIIADALKVHAKAVNKQKYKR